VNEMRAAELEKSATVIMESEKDGEKKIAFVDVENDEEREMELQMKALACGMHPSAAVVGSHDDEVGKPQRPFWGYRYMTPIELSDDDPVTSWTIIRTFEDDTGIHGVQHFGHAIGKSFCLNHVRFSNFRSRLITNLKLVSLMSLN